MELGNVYKSREEKQEFFRDLEKLGLTVDSFIGSQWIAHKIKGDKTMVFTGCDKSMMIWCKGSDSLDCETHLWNGYKDALKIVKNYDDKA